MQPVAYIEGDLLGNNEALLFESLVHNSYRQPHQEQGTCNGPS